MNSLRWRIATWYGLLLVSVIAVVGVIVVAKFQQILYQQAQGRVEGTMNDIARSVSLNPFADPSEIGSLAQRLGNPDNLEHWASQTTFVQVDNLQGYPVGKSFNMGAIQFPAAKGLDLKHDRQFRTVDAGGQPFLIEDRLIELTPQNAVVVHVGEPLNAVQLTIARAQQTVLFVVLLAIAVVVGFSIVLARQATNPLNELAQAMREIGSDHLDRRLKWARRHDEIGRVAETFDDMLARLEDAFAR
ncbi:MAG: HAMP domain-containing protein, partial [Candidatus Eremiobacteraeota bacterium]|nr:HAMP domain-containing protein [Candidatus Eremiobacteraeota bacterium]